MKRRLFNYSAFLLLSLGIQYSCSHQEVEQTKEEDTQPSSGVAFTQDQIKEAGIKFGQFEQAELSHDVYAKGKVKLPNNNLAQVSTLIGGMVAEIYVHQGSNVKKGEALCRLEHYDIIALQQEYLQAKYNLDVTTGQYERQELLLKEDVSSRKNFQVAERDYLAAKISYEALQMNARLAGFDMEALESGKIKDHLDVRSPINGNVNDININLGQYVTPGEPLFKVVDKSELHVEIMIFERDIPYVYPGQRVTMTLSNISEKVYEGEVFTVGSTMEETARTIPVLIHLKEIPQNAYPGMFVAATIHTGEDMFSALPEDAIVAEKEGEYYIYYTLDDYTTAAKVHFSKVQVMPGLIEDGYASMDLAEPLPEGAHLVVKGGYYIRSMFVRSVE